MVKKLLFLFYVVLALIVSYGLGAFILLHNSNTSFVPNALAFNDNYVDNLSFSYDSQNDLILQFHCKTTFKLFREYKNNYDTPFVNFIGWLPCNLINSKVNDTIDPDPYYDSGENDYYFEAGNDYTVYLNKLTTSWGDYTCIKSQIESHLGRPLNSDDVLVNRGILTQGGYSDWETIVNYQENPTLALTWPSYNSELSGDFQITGTATQPSPYIYNYLKASFSYYSKYGANVWVGDYLAPLSATSSQSFAIDVMSLPVSNPDSLEVLIQFVQLNSSGSQIASYGQSSSGYPDENPSPFDFVIKTMPEGQGLTYPEYHPNWPDYFDVFSPALSSDGYYHLNNSTGTLGFIYNFPDTYKVWIYEVENGDSVNKLATSTFATLDPDLDKRFYVDNFDATSTPYNVYAVISNPQGASVINMMFPVLYSATPVGPSSVLENTIFRLLKMFLVPSPSTVNFVVNGYKSALTSKIPFSYFYDIYNSIASSTIGEATSTPNFNIALGGSTISFNVFTIPNELTQTEGWQTFYNILKYGCYLTFVYYIIARVRGITEEGSD